MSSPEAVAPMDQYGLPAGLSSEEGEFDPLLFLAVGLLFDTGNIPLKMRSLCFIPMKYAVEPVSFCQVTEQSV